LKKGDLGGFKNFQTERIYGNRYMPNKRRNALRFPALQALQALDWLDDIIKKGKAEKYGR